MHRYVILNLLVILLIMSCKKESTKLIYDDAGDYLPLIPGKYIIYQVDSIVYLNLGTQKEVRSSVIQEKVDTSEFDQLGRKSFRIVQLTRNTNDTNKWTFTGAYRVTPVSGKIEVVQQNQRFIKLVSPIIQNYKWRGNAFINTTSSLELAYLDNWEYTYEETGSNQTFNNINYKDCINVLQNNDTIGNPGNKNFFWGINYSREIYARNIGLVYKEIHYELWQPANGNNSGYFEKGSFGFKFTALSHN